MSTATDAVSIKLPKFLVTTLEPKQQDGDKVVFNRYSKQDGVRVRFIKIQVELRYFFLFIT